MTLYKLLIAATMIASGAAFAADSHGDEAKPRHGGIVTVVKDLSYELVLTPTQISIHVNDHGKAVDATGATGKLTLLSGAAKQEVELMPRGVALEAKGNFQVTAGTKALAQVTLKGKAMQAVQFTIK